MVVVTIIVRLMIKKITLMMMAILKVMLITCLPDVPLYKVSMIINRDSSQCKCF